MKTKQKAKIPSEEQKPGIRVGLYIRVSTEEQAQNPEGSIKSQEQRLRQHLEFKNMDGFGGRVTHVFIDRARSGKDMNRPELRRLLQVIANQEIDLVMVSELSRISRSIRDFSQIWELMKAHKCYFLSLREQFDTTNAAGEMVLFTMANMAQFERKQISERVSANFLARAERGLFNGGSIPYGYDTDPNRPGSFVVVEDQALLVREAFQTYLSEGCLAKAGRSLNDRGFRFDKIRKNGGKKFRHGTFSISNLYPILRNVAYIGRRPYKDKNGKCLESKAVWDPIVDAITFEKVQKLLTENKSFHKSDSPHRFPYLLSKLVSCGSCGDRLCGKSAWGRSGKIAYYEHGWAVKRQAYLAKKIFACELHRIQAKVLETFVWQDVLLLLTEKAYAEKILDKAKVLYQVNSGIGELTRIRGKIRDFDAQIEALAEHLSKIPKGVSPTAIFGQMKIIEEGRKKLEIEADGLESSGAVEDPPAALASYESFIEQIGPLLMHSSDNDKRSRLLAILINKIVVFKDRIEIHYKAGIRSLIEGAKIIEKEDAQTTGLSLGSSESILSSNFGSNSLTLGTRGRNRTGTNLSVPRILSPVCLPISPREQVPHFFTPTGVSCLGARA